MKSGTASERAHEKAYKYAQEHRNSPKVRQMMKEAKQKGGAEGRAIQRGINNANGRNG
jgi:hypothetical protein